MAYMGLISVTCKNKICNDGNTRVNITTINNIVPNPLPPCPKCGFKTLDQFVMTNQEQSDFIDNMNASLLSDFMEDFK